MAEICRDCIFYEEKDRSCHLKPPVLTPIGWSHPKVGEDNWCGRFIRDDIKEKN